MTPRANTLASKALLLPHLKYKLYISFNSLKAFTMSATQPDSQTALPTPIPAQQPVVAPASQATPAKTASATKVKAKATPTKAMTKKAAATARKPAIDIAPKTPTKPVAKPVAEKLPKTKKPKLVRDSFTIPKPEYLVLEELKARAVALANPVKKTELIRAGIKALAALPDAGFLLAMKAVPVIKTGRPTKD